MSVDEIITAVFIPAISGGINCSNVDRKLFSFPSKLGGFESSKVRVLGNA